jgi:hypothetical protein
MQYDSEDTSCSKLLTSMLHSATPSTIIVLTIIRPYLHCELTGDGNLTDRALFICLSITGKRFGRSAFHAPGIDCRPYGWPYYAGVIKIITVPLAWCQPQYLLSRTLQYLQLVTLLRRIVHSTLVSSATTKKAPA